jgi:hypothetical protein
MLLLPKSFKITAKIFIIFSLLTLITLTSKTVCANKNPKQVEITYQENNKDNTIELQFSWQKKTAAAVFIRNDFLWIIFNQKENFNLSNLKTKFGNKLIYSEQINNKNNSILKFKIANLQSVKALKNEFDWKIILSFDDKKPLFPEKIIRQYNSNASNGIFFPLTDYSTPVIEIIDDNIGDMLSVIPLYDDDYGVPKTRKFVDFILYNSAQGVISKIISDHTYIKAITPGIEFIIPKNNFLKMETGFSKISKKDLLPKHLNKTRNSFVNIPLASSKNFSKIKSTLDYQIMMAKDDDRIIEIFKLVTFYFASEFYQEASSLARSCINNYDYEKIPTELFLLSIMSDYMIAKDIDALKTLSLINKNTLQNYQLIEIKIWEIILSKNIENLQDMFLANKKIPEAIQNYPSHIKNKILLNIIDLLIIQDIEFENLKWLINYIQDRNVNIYVQNDLFYYEAFIDYKNNKHTSSFRILKHLREQNQDMKNNLRANILYYNIALEQNIISAEKVILELNKLRLIWRGDEYESSLLEKIGDLYLQILDYENAFKTFDIAYKASTKPNHRLALSAKISNSFMLFFIDKDAINKISNFNSISLFYEYRDFLPVGQEADKIITSVINRMINLHLLNKAIILLKHQIEYRLSGDLKNRAIIQLSQIYNLNNQTELSIDNINHYFPNINKITLDPFEVELNQTLSQSYILQNNYDKAYEYVKDDFTDKSNQMKIQILTKQKNWITLRELLMILTKDTGSINSTISEQEDYLLMKLILCHYMLNDHKNIISMYNNYYKKLDRNTISMQLLLLLSSQEVFFDPKDPVNTKTLDQFKNFTKNIKKYSLVPQ